MLVLLFHSQEDRYACSTDLIVEILPHLELKKITHSPVWIGGSFDYAGYVVPVIDWCQLIKERPSSCSLHSRTILFKLQKENEEAHYIGLMAEKVISTKDIQLSNFIDNGIAINNPSYFGGVMNDKRGPIQYVKIASFFEELSPLICRSHL